MNPYKHADKALKTLKKRISGEFQNLSTTLPFDELNILDTRKSVNDLYERVNTQCVKQYQKVAEDNYKEAVEECDGEYAGLDETFLAAILSGYNPITEYVYKREWTRKADRTFEGLLAAIGLLGKRNSLLRSHDLVQRQVRQYVDIATDEARMQGFRDNGITRVQWVSIADERRCKVCRERDGQIYEIGNVPVKHRNCRCYLIPVLNDRNRE